MNDTYPSLVDIMDEVAKYGFDYKKLTENRVPVFGPLGAVKFTRQADNTWKKDRAGF
jgi:hypothetical protein